MREYLDSERSLFYEEAMMSDFGRASASEGRYPQLEAVLRTEEGFKSSIRYSSVADSVLGVVILLALARLIYNLVATFSTLNAAGLSVRGHFLEVFLDTQGKGNMAVVWLPIIAVPVIVVLLIGSRLTRGGAITKVYDQYRQGGFVAELIPTGIPVVSNNTRGMLFLIASPRVPSDWVPAAIEQLRTKLNTDPTSRETKAYKFAVSSLTVPGAGTQAGQVNKADPSLPEGIFVCSQQSNQGLVRIAVPIGDDHTRLKLWPLRKEVVLA